MQGIETVRRAHHQDTFDLRDQMLADDHGLHAQAHADAAAQYTSDEEHSVLEDDSDGEGADGDYIDDDDGSSELSIPNESIDFDLVYALHSFAATVEGQANVVKGDSLILMDDSNSYWWLVRVLKTQEVGYIPAENIETPFERLARLNKHRNVDLSSPTHVENQGDGNSQRDRLRPNASARAGPNTPSPTQRVRSTKSVIFQSSFQVHRYPPAVWGDEDDDEEDVEWDDEGYEDEDPELVDDRMDTGVKGVNMEPDDGMSWEDGAAEEQQARARMQNEQTNGLPAPSVVEPRQLSPQQMQLQSPLQQQQAQTQRLENTSPVSSSPKSLDPAQATETLKLSVTPPLVRDQQTQQPPAGPPVALPSAIMQQQENDRKRQREEIEALEFEARKKVNKTKEKAVSPSSSSEISTRPASGGKLRKEKEKEKEKEMEEEAKEKDKKKKGGMLSGLFGRKKDKGKEKTASLTDSASMETGRGSQESGRSSNAHLTTSPSETGLSSPTTAAARQQQQQQMQQQQTQFRNSTDPKRQQQQQQQLQQQQDQPFSQGSTSPPSTPPQNSLVSQHASQLRQRDQQQQALYQQYLNRSPSSPPELQPSYGLQSASAIMAHTSSFNSSTSSAASGIGLSPEAAGGPRRPRPGSLVLSPTAVDGQGVPELSVIRIFAGTNLQTEATFKTVLLNTSTTSQDLVRQAIQRFRLPAGEDANDYYLTIKQVEGSSAMLRPHEKPLGVFENLVEAAMELPKVKRSSVGSISSVASNLSLHPAIRKLSMNDFTDDSAVKFYLNRRGVEGGDDSGMDQEGDETLIAEEENGLHAPKPQYLSVLTGGGPSVTPERFSSPSFRFAMQLVIHTDDLPDDMVFDPQTEAIVFKSTLRDRGQLNVPPGISMTQRRKVFVFPKNVTVAEVIEIGLERFGILEGVVDGGDEVEDKLSKRKSSSRVRYGLSVYVGGQEKELLPTSKVIDAYSQPPTYRTVDRRFSENKRRSVDSSLLVGNPEDVGPEDPTFVLRRAVTYRTSSARHRSSAPLDEIALQHLHQHRESASSSSATSESASGTAEDTRQRQPSKQEVIAAQRAAVRANQRAILSAQTNSVRGVDVLLPGNAIIRSSRYDVDDKMRYSYVDADGETFDISDIVEEEWRGERRESNVDVNNRNDLLEGVLGRNKDVLGEKLDRVLGKIKEGRGNGRSFGSFGPTQDSFNITPTTSTSEYSVDQTGVVLTAPSRMSSSRSETPVVSNGRTPTPTSAGGPGGQRTTTPSGSRMTTPASFMTASEGTIRTRTNTPLAAANKNGLDMHQRQASSASVVSDASGYRSTAGTPMGRSKSSLSQPQTQRAPKKRKPFIPKDDWGMSGMMAVIELRAASQKANASMMAPQHKAVDPVDEMWFGKPVDMEGLHPQVREVYADSFKQLEEMDEILDELLRSTNPAIPSF